MTRNKLLSRESEFPRAIPFPPKPRHNHCGRAQLLGLTPPIGAVESRREAAHSCTEQRVVPIDSERALPQIRPKPPACLRHIIVNCTESVHDVIRDQPEKTAATAASANPVTKTLIRRPGEGYAKSQPKPKCHSLSEQQRNLT